MKNSKIAGYAILNSLGVLIYTSGVAWLLFNGGRILGNITNFLGPLALLLLFVFSATVVGLLVLGRPALLYFNGAKSDAIKLLLFTMGWLCVMILAVFGILLLWM